MGIFLKQQAPLTKQTHVGSSEGWHSRLSRISGQSAGLDPKSHHALPAPLGLTIEIRPARSELLVRNVRDTAGVAAGLFAVTLS